MAGGHLTRGHPPMSPKCVSDQNVRKAASLTNRQAARKPSNSQTRSQSQTGRQKVTGRQTEGDNRQTACRTENQTHRETDRNQNSRAAKAKLETS